MGPFWGEGWPFWMAKNLVTAVTDCGLAPSCDHNTPHWLRRNPMTDEQAEKMIKLLTDILRELEKLHAALEKR